MKKAIIMFIFILSPFYVLADPYQDIMNKPSFTFNDIKLLYNSKNEEHHVYLRFYFKSLLEGIATYDSMLVLENKDRIFCASNFDYLMKLTLLSNNIEMIENTLTKTKNEYLAETESFSLLYMRALKYNYPCKK